MPDEVIAKTYREVFTRTSDSNIADTSFAAKVPTVTQPSGDGIVPCSPHGAGTDYVSSSIMFLFFGTDAANETFNIRIYGWEKCVLSGSDDLWMPIKLIAATCTLGTMVGVASAAIVNTDFVVDTISSVEGTPLRSVYSPADNLAASLVLDTHGFDALELNFDMTGAASGCAMFRRF